MKGSVLSVLVLICVSSSIEGHVDPTPPPITVGKILDYSNYFCKVLFNCGCLLLGLSIKEFNAALF